LHQQLQALASPARLASMLSTENFAHQSRALTASALKITPEAEVKLAAKNTLGFFRLSYTMSNLH
jgi:hypothetical protein